MDLSGQRIVADRDAWRARAEQAERERDALRRKLDDIETEARHVQHWKEKP